MLRKTKIIATLGPASESLNTLKALIESGVNIFRLNMSHSTHEWVRAIVPKIRQISADLGIHIGILMDTQGPAIRTGDLPTKLDLKSGDIVEFTVQGARSIEQYSVDVNYDGLINDISIDDVVLVDNGMMQMKVLDKKNNKIRCKVLTPGKLGSRRHINLPGVKINLPPLTEKDIADIEIGVEVGVDFFALSFCREASDIEEFRRVLRTHGSTTPIIAKIEDQNAVKSIDAIIEASDIIMIARGDLGIECPLEELPIIQRRIVKHCIAIGRPVIVATHMLESMIENPSPTRAEITDVANAVFEQVDAIMLSGETTVGKYPVECVKIFDRVAKRIERSGGAGYASEAIITDPRHKMVKSAIVLANSFSNGKVVVFTRRGILANYASQLRPHHAPIFAFSPDETIVRRMAVNRGTFAIHMPFEIQPEHTVAEAEVRLKKMGFAESGDRLIVVSDICAGDERFDSIHLREIP